MSLLSALFELELAPYACLFRGKKFRKTHRLKDSTKPTLPPGVYPFAVNKHYYYYKCWSWESEYVSECI